MSAGANNNAELDSQLSAMFDGELPETECELLARRLARDEMLKRRWGRYATIGAAIRAEGTLHIESRLAQRVSAAVAEEPALLVGASRAGRGLSSPSAVRWWQPVAGVALAGSVAALALLWMRAQSPPGALIAQSSPLGIPSSPPAAIPQTATPSAAARLTPAARTARPVEPDSYVVPTATGGTSLVPPAMLANYVVAHSEFSTPLLRHNLLSALVAAEAGTPATPPESESPTRRKIESAEPAR